jgi:hypothetical protein
LTLRVRREALDGPLELEDQLRVISSGGNLDLPVKARVLDYPDLVVSNLLVESVEFSVNGQPRAVLGLGGSQRLRLDSNPITVDWRIQPRLWEGQALGLAFSYTGQPVLLSQDLEVFSPEPDQPERRHRLPAVQPTHRQRVGQRPVPGGELQHPAGMAGICPGTRGPGFSRRLP